MHEHAATDRAALARSAAVAGGEVAAEFFRTGVAVETKAGKTDVVTEADRAAQREVEEAIRAAHPAEPIVGEEGEALKSVPETGPAWVVDPIDGTNSFVRELTTWATAVACVVGGEPVAACNVLPALDDVYTADGEAAYRNGAEISVSTVSDPERAAVVPTVWWPRERRDEYARACEAIVSRFADLRRPGSAQAALAMVAAGAVEGVITNVQTRPWDTISGVHLVRQAGGTVTDLRGEPWRHDARGLVVSNGELHDEMLAAAREIDADR
ncbi:MULTISPECIES: inositol monophosphatase family protein [Halolamina]|uniref:fructose-bisphosphatase n=1 Tax=Halolamina pelagica TaxID=699431 RepID=A0A1I5ME37_9EURY|nr:MULTISPECIES: inositol monophosphatase [Halolamina]NHX35964.1 inositol monophosphatase [Halolamina sp. R1-12]SFP07201.1 myo-inositol-1(or 4)-monophosphatase [Halolamina pelagica]